MDSKVNLGKTASKEFDRINYKEVVKKWTWSFFDKKRIIFLKGLDCKCYTFIVYFFYILKILVVKL